jgi:putative hydrolase of the HAD superfamily
VSRWRAIIFDLDDTLYAERQYVLSGFGAVARWAEAELGLPAAESYAALAGLYAQGVRGSTFDQWLAQRGLPGAELTPRMVAAYRAHAPELRPFPEAPALLAQLRRDHRLGLVSDGYLDVQRRKLAALGLEPLLDAVVFSDELGRVCWKPSPAPFVEVCRRLGVAPTEAIYVADNPAKDFAGPRSLGMASVWSRWPDGEYTAREPLGPAYAPDWIIGGLGELPGLLEKTLVRL